MIDIKKLKSDYAEGKAVNPQNVRMLIDEVEVLCARAEAAEKRAEKAETETERLRYAIGYAMDELKGCDIAYYRPIRNVDPNEAYNILSKALEEGEE